MMTHLDNRKTAILWSVIEQYVETAVPVSSQDVLDAGATDASPATIRAEMVALEREGFLMQPHTSAGRIPTEEAYRLYVAELMRREERAVPREVDLLIRVIEEADSLRNMGKGIARFIAAEVSQAIVVSFGRGDAYATGISYVIVQPEFHDPELLHAFSQALDRLDETLDALELHVGTEPTVVLGAENPFGAQCGTVASRLQLPHGHEVMLGVVGPMRMAYDQQLSMLYSLQEVFGKRT